uniref:Ribosome biogenesis protein BMS1/TSR1 C-terminal domain-containing protein n=1 Tax=Entomoneis paludosa TaxID=265537 RepID=A0A7S3DX58_9STRA
MPTVLTVLAQTEKDPLDLQLNNEHMTMLSVKSLRRSGIKRRLDLKKYLSRFATTEFGTGNDKVVEVDLSSRTSNSHAEGDDHDNMMMQDGEATVATGTDLMTASTGAALRSNPATLVRTLCTMSCVPSKWVANSPRTWLLSDRYNFDPATNELSISGYLRGMAPWDIHSLVHIPNVGTFAPKAITKQSEQSTPIGLVKRRHHGKKGLAADAEMGSSSNDNVLIADAEQQESLNMFATPDALAGEQNLIGFDDDGSTGNADDDEGDADGPIARPAGWSDYQSAWLDGVGDDGFDDDMDRGELAEALNKKKSDASVGGFNDIDLEDANNVSQTERLSLLEQRRKEQSENDEFPDEVQVGEDEDASKRFARYRSLKSFRKSFWDPKENLPDSFASVYHFSSFKATQRSVMNDMKESMRAADEAQGNFFGKAPVNEADETMGDESEEEYDPLEGCIPTGTYVTLTLGNVSKESMQSLCPKSLLTAVSLLEHENKVSVLHMGLSQSTKMAPSDNVPIKSKDILTFRCGWRTWQARPIFSQNNLNCDKHKFERFLPMGGAFFAASIFGPVTYTPCPVLVWKDIQGKPELVAAGTMMNADADRIVIKRVILTGYPVRVHKRHATVKYMFYNPEDVKWFKPAELYSKHGLRGNIMESVGEHGTMKCLFNAPIKQHDTVCLPLYKRVYPKYVPSDEQDTLIIK